ncbi:MAG: 4Fe-4S double cluster binding domain-containing protein [Candidatus Hermodarchaeota archaeon]
MESSDCYSNFVYKFKTVSVNHLEELQEEIDKLRQAGKLSDNEIYRSYINTRRFEIPKNLPTAKSIIIIAIFTKLALINFYLKGKEHEIMIPPNYYDDGLTNEILENLILEKIIKEPGYKIELTRNLHLKLLAVRSGLGKYGRNNICYIDEMGSMLNLYACYTDYKFKEDNWTEMKMMDCCRNCKICINNCPTNAIPSPLDETFVINAGRCISVYNEIDGEIPNWISADAHNALMGCMKCQLSCPGNREVIKLTDRFEDITETETKMILEGITEKAFLYTLSKKLKIFSPSDGKRFFPRLKRNLELLIE